jgi:2-phosphosulfolactate phosphatase
MSTIDIQIIQGTEQEYPAANINIVIDVIRAFTVSHVAFLRGVREIFLVNTVEEAYTLKASNPDYLLAGEVGGLPIENFELDNSPYTFSIADIKNRTLVQKTTNGVKATLLALNADTILVTGFSNAKKTATYARHLAAGMPHCTINIIASHARDEDDLICAEYIREILLGNSRLKPEEIKSKIRASRPAQKFFDPQKPAFDPRDMDFCCEEITCDFVMEVDKSTPIPKIVKKRVPGAA